jgi:hypothetical protein
LRFVIVLFGELPRLLGDDVTVQPRDQGPDSIEGTREVEVVVVLADLCDSVTQVEIGA